ncbi:MAG: Txe/YoeB family addiction module toxin [Peptostreptococcaceae bacterium]|nr:Txe/YoeB family addiction module toxin [Peptostreptococcaceae bacterium]
MVEYKILIHKKAQKDKVRIEKIKKLKEKVSALIDILKINPYQNPHPYEKLVGDLKGACSRRIDIKHRLVYTVDEENKNVKILSMWTHYEI